MSEYLDHARRHASGGSDPLLSELKAIRLWDFNDTQTVGDNNDALVTFDTVSSFDTAVFSTVGSPITSVHLLLAGWYAMFFQHGWTASFTAGNNSIHFLFTGDTLSGASFTQPNDSGGLHVGPYPSASLTRYFPADAVDALPGAPQVWVSQNSGVTRTIADKYWHIVYLGPGDF